MTIMFGLKPGSRAATTSRKSLSADTQITTASQLPASSAKFAKANTLSSAASVLAFSGVRFQTPVSSPAR